jgi:hypothetical protein
MNIKRTTTVLRVIAAVIIIAMVAILANHLAGILAGRAETYLSSQKDAPSAGVPVNESPETVTEETAGQVDDELPIPAKRIVQVPDSWRSNGDVEFEESLVSMVTAENLVPFTASAIEKALDGELDAAVSLRRLRWLCEETFNPDSPYRLNIEQHHQWAEEEGEHLPPEGKPKTLTGGEGISFTLYPTEEQNMAHIDRWFDACATVRTFWSPETRGQLRSLAERGDVMARYLYASWKPRESIKENAFDEYLEWQLNALEFSMANLEEGEPAGLLAFGESFTYMLFTSIHSRLGAVMMKAALDCGLESAKVEEMAYRHRGSSPPELNAVEGESQADLDLLLERLRSICR